MVNIRLERTGWVDASLLIAFIVAAFLMGGSARGDTLSLVVLRPLAVIAAAWALATVGPRLWRDYRGVALFGAAAVLLVALQLVPLPPAIWTSFPGRDVAVKVSEAVGLPIGWRPLSLVPARTWNSLFALSVPIAVGALAIKASGRYRWAVLCAMVALGTLSALVGLMQMMGADVYPYRISTVGQPSGLFGNRNHQAVLLASMFPMLAVFASGRGVDPRTDRLTRILSVAIGLLLIPLLLITGSRAGVFAGLLGLASVPLIYAPESFAPRGRPVRERARLLVPSRQMSILIAVGAIALLGAVTIVASRAESVKRVVQADGFQSRRAVVFEPVLDLTSRQFTSGAGFGTFADVYRVGEPDAALAPTFLNQAHNDWLQVVIEGGIPGACLLIWAALAWGRAAVAAFRNESAASARVRHARAGATVVLLLGIASIFDYPLRTPALVAIFAMCFIWMVAIEAQDPKGERVDKDIGRRTRAGEGVGSIA